MYHKNYYGVMDIHNYNNNNNEPHYEKHNSIMQGENAVVTQNLQFQRNR